MRIWIKEFSVPGIRHGHSQQDQKTDKNLAIICSARGRSRQSTKNRVKAATF
jgi:hypothetical protein